MNETDRDNHEVEQLLRKVRPVEPSAEARQRITGAAREAWNESGAGRTWRIAFRRLGVSAAAAVVMISIAEYASYRAVAPWQSCGPPAVARVEIEEIEEWPEMPRSPALRQLVATRRPAGPDAATLLDYMERMRETLSETEQGRSPKAPAPTNGRSGLLPDRSYFRCCS